MPFLSIEFVIFFLLFFPVYWWLRPSAAVQNELLVLLSLALLAFLQVYFALIVIAFTIVVGFIAARIHSCDQHTGKRRWLIAGIIAALMNLFAFKYLDDYRPMLQSVWGDVVPDLLLPLGISYYTFQGIAYLVALYHEEIATKSSPYSCHLTWLQLLLHFSFFPTVTAGPIARAAPSRYFHGEHVGMAMQIKTHKRRVVLRPALALSLIGLGIIKVWWFAGVIADYWVVPVFDNPWQYDRATLLLAIYGYTLELFLNFSGYTDLVIGMAMLLGFQLPPNFDRPLRAVNIRDFWHRWHMTLSTWIRDYIYIPLGGSRCGFWRTQVHVLVAMILSGIWHGNGWPFLLWGTLHGIALVILNIAEKVTGRRALFGHTIVAHGLAVLLTLTFVAMAFVFFRAERLDDAWLMFAALYGSNVMLDSTALLMLSFLVLALWGYGCIERTFFRFVTFVEAMPYWLWPLPFGLIVMVVMILAPSGIPGFIYADF